MIRHATELYPLVDDPLLHQLGVQMTLDDSLSTDYDRLILTFADEYFTISPERIAMSDDLFNTLSTNLNYRSMEQVTSSPRDIQTSETQCVQVHNPHTYLEENELTPEEQLSTETSQIFTVDVGPIRRSPPVVHVRPRIWWNYILTL